MRRSQGMHTIGLVSTPAPHNTLSPVSPGRDSNKTQQRNTAPPTLSIAPTNFPATFITTPMEHLDFTLSQISPGLGVDNLQPPVSSPPPHKGTSSTSTSPVATPSSYPRYESVFKSRFAATPPLSTLSIKPTATTTSSTYSSSRIYTITSPTTLRDPNTTSAFTSIPTSVRPLESSPLASLSTFTGAPPPSGTDVTTFIRTTAATGKTPSPEHPLRVHLDGSGGYDNLRFEPDGAQPKTNLEAWQAKQKGRQ